MPKHSLLCAACVLLAAVPLYADEAEDQAVKAVEKLGGMVIRDDKDPERPVIEVKLYDAKVTDADLKELAALKALRTLDLCVSKVTDANLKELATLKGLQELDLDGTLVTDAGLKELEAIQGYRRWISAAL